MSKNEKAYELVKTYSKYLQIVNLGVNGKYR